MITLTLLSLFLLLVALTWRLSRVQGGRGRMTVESTWAAAAATGVAGVLAACLRALDRQRKGLPIDLIELGVIGAGLLIGGVLLWRLRGRSRI